MIRRSADIDGQQACLARESLILRCSSAGNDGQVASLARETLIRRRRSADIDGRGTSLARRASLRRKSADIDGRGASLGPPLHQRRDLRHDGWLPFLRLAHPLNAIMFDRSPTFNASLQSKSTEPGAKVSRRAAADSRPVGFGAPASEVELFAGHRTGSTPGMTVTVQSITATRAQEAVTTRLAAFECL